MKCPRCGVPGPKWEDEQFEIRGQVEGAPIRKCCPPSAEPGLRLASSVGTKEIPGAMWAKMDAAWARTFPPSDAEDGLEPGVPILSDIGSLPWLRAHRNSLNDDGLRNLENKARAAGDESILRWAEEGRKIAGEPAPTTCSS